MVLAVQSVFAQYASWAGRASRAEYWWFALFIFLVEFVSLLLIALSAFLVVVYIVLALAFIIPSATVFIRRLHDTDHSGWWWLIGFIPLVGTLYLLYLLVIPGTPGPNRFGPPHPLA